MFSVGTKIGASITGTADNCECIPREQINQQFSSKFLLDGEIPFIFLKSSKEDHIITDRAYIAVRGETAGGMKRITYRVDFQGYPLSNVMFESGGMGLTDQDCELKFTIANQNVSIDIRKSDQETGILYYRALTALAIAQARQVQSRQFYVQSSEKSMIQIAETSGANAAQNRATQNISLAATLLEQLSPVSYASVLQTYIY